MNPRFRKPKTGPAPYVAQGADVLPASAKLQLPARVRHGMDRVITHEYVTKAIKAFKKRGGVIRRINSFPQLREVEG